MVGGSGSRERGKGDKRYRKEVGEGRQEKMKEITKNVASVLTLVNNLKLQSQNKAIGFK